MFLLFNIWQHYSNMGSVTLVKNQYFILSNMRFFIQTKIIEVRKSVGGTIF